MVMFTFFRLERIFGQIWTKKLKLSVKAEIWYLDQLEFDGDIQSVLDRKDSFSASFVRKNPFGIFMLLE